MRINGDSEFSDDDWSNVRDRLGLSDREVDVCRLICRGRKLGSIATRMGIKESTVRTHVRRLYAKLEVNNRASLVMRLASARAEAASAELSRDS